MITTHRRPFVSIAVMTSMTVALAACVSAGSRPVQDQTSIEEKLVTIRFDNVSRETVDVYLIGTKREWMLGRVAPGAIASLRLPDEAFAEGAVMMRLAVLAGEPKTLAAARDPRAILTLAAPASRLVSQRWTFSQGSLMSLPY